MNRTTLATLTAFVLTAALAPAAANAVDAIDVYGPGGPAPAMKEAARKFGDANGLVVNVVAGPTLRWVDKAKGDADVVYDGFDNRMSDFAEALPGAFDRKKAEPLDLRPVAILVRPGNPRNITGFRDLLKPGVEVMAVAGAGQTGLRVEVAGRTGDIGMVRSFRENLLLPEAADCAEARQRWTQEPDIDV